jgi:hypothetical protein
MHGKTTVKKVIQNLYKQTARRKSQTSDVTLQVLQHIINRKDR